MQWKKPDLCTVETWHVIHNFLVKHSTPVYIRLTTLLSLFFVILAVFQAKNTDEKDSIWALRRLYAKCWPLFPKRHSEMLSRMIKPLVVCTVLRKLPWREIRYFFNIAWTFSAFDHWLFVVCDWFKMGATINNPANWEVHAVIWFLVAKYNSATEIHRPTTVVKVWCYKWPWSWALVLFVQKWTNQCS